MIPSFASGLDALSDWRSALGRRIDALSHFLAAHELGDAESALQIASLHERLRGDKLVVAFVAEFSRGKSELINAVFFGDTGRRMLPATPGRTTMCPVELAWDGAEAASLRLLPIETRLENLSLADLRQQHHAWTTLALDVEQPMRLAESLAEVTRTRPVTVGQARLLGLWDDTRPDDNPQLLADGKVEVPVWRHALINYPHPLLKQGLVVLDTPGLNAIGAEPELTLSLLPSAHATVFVLGADTGVTRSDLGLWRDHLASSALSRFVVLNKIDTLDDPLSTAEEVALQIERQCRDSAALLNVPVERVFALSARHALTARIAGDAAALVESRLPQLELALCEQLLPHRREVLEHGVHATARHIESRLARRLGEQRRQLADQLLELDGLRGKSSGRLQLMLKRVDAEALEFEDCANRLQAMRLVQGRMIGEALAGLSVERLRSEIGTLQTAMTASLLNLGARKAFSAACVRLSLLLTEAQHRSAETRGMLAASCDRLNAEFGFSLALDPAPELDRFVREIGTLERNYLQYLGVTQALKLSQPKFMEQFRRMLMSRLRAVFDSASSVLEQWSRQATVQIEAQLRERRLNFVRRREALEQIQSAAGELEQRIGEIRVDDARLQQLLADARELTRALHEQARAPAERATATA